MNTIKILAAFLALTALTAISRAESTESSTRVIELPPVIVEATRVSPPVIEVSTTLDEIRAEANLSLRLDMRRALGRNLRRLAADQRRTSPVVEMPATKPNV